MPTSIWFDGGAWASQTTKLLNSIAADISNLKKTVAAIQAQEITDMSDLSDQIAALGTNLAKVQADMNTAFNDLEAAVAAGNSTDIANAVTALRAANSSLQDMDTAALAADATTKPSP